MAILYIDDEALLLDLLGRVLQQEGFNVLTADSAVKGIEILKREGSNVAGVICDGVANRFDVEDYCHENKIPYCLHSASETVVRYPESEVVVKGQKETRDSLLAFCSTSESREGRDKFAV